MSSRLQVLVHESLHARIRKAASRKNLSAGAWVRAAIEAALVADQSAADPVERLSRLEAPTGDLTAMHADPAPGR
jgi:hypothetical protein